MYVTQGRHKNVRKAKAGHETKKVGKHWSNVNIEKTYTM